MSVASKIFPFNLPICDGLHMGHVWVTEGRI